MQRFVPAVLILIAGLIAGFVLGRVTAPESVSVLGPGASVAAAPRDRVPSLRGFGSEDDDDTVPPAPADFTLEQAMRLSPGDDRDNALERLGMRAGMQNPEEARTMLDRISKTQDKEMYLYGVVEGFARRDPEGCLDFLASLAPGMLRETGFEHALELIAEADPGLAATKASELLEGVSAFNALLSISDVWAESDPQAALAWASAQQSSQFRAATVEQIAVTWGDNDPEQAIRGLTAAGELTAEEREMAMGAVLASWAGEDPGRAVQWARSNPSSIGSTNPMSVVLVNWAAEEPSAAAAALIQENNPVLLESTAPEIAGIWGAHAPSEAARWVGSIPSETARQAASLQLVQEWARVDISSARQWAEALPEKDGLRAAALQRLESPGAPFDSQQLMPEAAPQSPEEAPPVAVE